MIRSARAEDLHAATEVFLTTLDDLRVRHNASGAKMNFNDWLPGYEHVWRTGIFNVAEKDGKIVGVCNGVIRDKRWFLTGFWLLPGHQGEGLGGQLIEKTWADARAQGAVQFFVWASIDWPALANYMKLGMLPGYQIFTMSIEKAKFTENARTVKSENYRLEALTAEQAGDIDFVVRETRRPQDHQFWLATMKSQAFIVKRQGATCGYFYCRNGTIGPLAYLDTADGAAILHLALQEVFKDSEKAILYVPGANHIVLSEILAGGGRMLSLAHFLSTDQFGKPAQYLPSGPLLY